MGNFKYYIVFFSIGMLLQVHHVLSENIIMFHHYASYSHPASSYPLASELAARGHKVSYISPFHNRNSNPNITEHVTRKLVEYINGFLEGFDVNRRVNKDLDPLVNIFEVPYTACDILFKSPEFHNFMLENPKVDLVIIDNCFLNVELDLRTR